MTEISVRQAFNLIYAHLLSQTAHTDCKEKPGLGLVCAEDCGTRQFLAWLEEPLTSWEIEEEERRKKRWAALRRGEIAI